MSDFGGKSMASGYARWRPAVHPLVIEAARPYTGVRDVGVDVGCGAGLSRRALEGIARVAFGIDPLESMIRLADRSVVAAARAEELPFRAASIDVLSAAGSLNYVDLTRFFPEAARMLTPDGVLLIYDFSPGRSFPEDKSLDRWYWEFERRYPPPSGSARPLDPEILHQIASGFQLAHGERFAYRLELTPEFYLEYVLTETSVAHAVRRGTSSDSIRSWCAESLADVFDRPRQVLFRGYFVIFRRV